MAYSGSTFTKLFDWVRELWRNEQILRARLNAEFADIATGLTAVGSVASMSTDRLLGRDSAGTGAAEQLTVGGGIEFTGAGGVQTSAFTGDATKAAGGTTLTLASVITAGGPTGSSSVVPVITYDAKGRLTAVTTATITPAAIGAQPVDADLTAIAAFAGTGIAVRTGTDAWAQRSIAAGAGITVTNGDGVAANPSVALTSPVTAVLGGTGQIAYTLGDLLYSDAANSLAKLAGNTTTTRKFLRMTGTGTAAAAPVWDTIAAADIPGSALTKTDDTNVTLTLGGSPATALLNAASITVGWTGRLALARFVQATATDKLLGRATAGAGDFEEIACTAAGRALIDDADAAAQRTTLGLGTAATQNTGTSGTTVPLLDGANTFSGINAFTAASITFGSGESGLVKINGGASAFPAFQLQYAGVTKASARIYDSAGGFVLSGDGSGTHLYVSTTGHTQPGGDNTYSCGTASLRWSVVYAATSTINTSDADDKTNFRGPENDLLLAALDTPQHLFQWLDAVAEKGEAARWHFGPTAQGFRDACLARGIDPRRFAGYCEDPIGDGKTRHGLRLDQFDRLLQEARWRVLTGRLIIRAEPAVGTV